MGHTRLGVLPATSNWQQVTAEGGMTVRTTVLRIGAALLCIASMTLACSCDRQEHGAAQRVLPAPTGSRVAANQGRPEHVSFDPKGDRLIVVWEPVETSERSGSPYEVILYPFYPFDGVEARVIGRCSSASVAWNAKATRVYVTQGSVEGASIVELGFDGDILGESPVFASGPGGRLSYNRQLDLLVLLHESGDVQTLKLWWPETDRLETVGLPVGFVADLASQPYICGIDPRVVLVSADHQSFAAYDVDRECWQYASLTPAQDEWSWHDWPADGVRGAGWQLLDSVGGAGSVQDYFFVDGTGSTLWCAADTAYRHMSPPREDGSIPYVSPAHYLVPLDVPSRQPAPRHRTVRLSVYGWALLAVAGSHDRETVAVLYGDTENTDPGETVQADCVAYRLPPAPSPGTDLFEYGRDYREKHFLYENGEVLGSGGIAMSSEGREVAVVVAGDVASQPRLVIEGLFWRLDRDNVRRWTVPLEAADITADQLRAKIDDGDPLVLADVRTPTEFASGHIPGAVNLPLDDIDTWADTLNPFIRTCCICQSRGYNGTAGNRLVAKGFTQVYNLLGGMDGWPGPTEP